MKKRGTPQPEPPAIRHPAHAPDEVLNRKYLIWSEEHGAWWGPNAVGYTRSIKEAGRYAFKAAFEIEARANQYLDINAGDFHEVVIPDPLPL